MVIVQEGSKASKILMEQTQKNPTTYEYREGLTCS